MAKSKRKRNKPGTNNKKQNAGHNQGATSIDANKDRRKFLGYMKYGAVGALAVGFGGYKFMGAVEATQREADLSLIGKGKPVIAQIHDPTCSVCAAFQKQVRSAMSSLDEEKFSYVVANIKTNKGSALAAKYGVPHVTLLLFDGNGKMVQTVRGPANDEILSSIIENFVKTHG